MMSEPTKIPRFSYADYENALRAPHYEGLRRVSREAAQVFRACRQVLDIASGQGLMLDALREIGVPAFGVDSEADLVRACRERGLEVAQQDALNFLVTTPLRFDGVHCSHFIEHLPYEALLDLVEGARRVLEPGGLFAVSWPNPRSTIAQQTMYWKDPTHRWFYDGDLVRAILEFYGFAAVRVHYSTVRPRVFSAPGASSSLAVESRTGLRRHVGRLFYGLRDGPLGSRLPLRPLFTLAERIQVWGLHTLWASRANHLPPVATIIARRGES